MKRSWPVKFERQFKHRDESNLNGGRRPPQQTVKSAGFAGVSQNLKNRFTFVIGEPITIADKRRSLDAVRRQRREPGEAWSSPPPRLRAIAPSGLRSRDGWALHPDGGPSGARGSCPARYCQRQCQSTLGSNLPPTQVIRRRQGVAPFSPVRSGSRRMARSPCSPCRRSPTRRRGLARRKQNAQCQQHRCCQSYMRLHVRIRPVLCCDGSLALCHRTGDAGMRGIEPARWSMDGARSMASQSPRSAPLRSGCSGHSRSITK